MAWRTRPELHSTSHILIQATPFCNIDCTYCYLPHRDRKQTLSKTVLEKFLHELVDNGALAATVRVSWHVGEPLAVRQTVLEEHCQLIQDVIGPHAKVKFSIQTNAMLVTPRWIEFFKRFSVGVGVSIDGPQEFHDAHRVTRQGKGTFREVMRGVGVLRAHGVKFGVICVLTPASLRAADEMFAFFTQNGMNSVSFNVEETVGAHVTPATDGEDIRELSRAFFRRYFELVAQHPTPHRVRELHAILDVVRFPIAAPRTQVSQPGRVLSFSADGRVSTFSPELLTWNTEDAEKFQFADLGTGALADLSTSEKFLAALHAIDAGYERCQRECDYFRFCGGGAPAAKFAELGRFDATATNYCRAKIMAGVDAFLDVLATATDLPPADLEEFEL